MKPFLNRDFLLQTPTASDLYHTYAATQPILDYHCHINPTEILDDRHYASVTEVWLGGDHYKWRAMRLNGVAEKYITGQASDWEKFQKWAETVPNLIGNPLYHWTHLELQRYFGITEPLTGKNARDVYDHCNQILAQKCFGVRGIIEQSNVKLICTTDDPVDPLDTHKNLALDQTFSTVVLPAFRPDKAMRADKADFADYVTTLEQAVGFSIHSMEDMRHALLNRIAYFADCGCCVSDHALDYCFCQSATEQELNTIFQKARTGTAITEQEQAAYHTALLVTVGEEYLRRNWVMQLHFGCLRNNSTEMYRRLGPDTGFDAMNDAPTANGLARLLDLLDRNHALPKTILYSLNPADNGIINTVAGCFQVNSDIPGRVQQGSAWWFNDNKDGIEAQLRSVMNLGCLATFNGMLTDSRSFLSYTRHEYFRRILCNLLGSLVECGEYPDDRTALGEIIERICYHNTVRFFGFDRYLSSTSYNLKAIEIGCN